MTVAAVDDGLRLFQPVCGDRLAKLNGLHLALGVFDGVHLGHQAVLQSARNAAQAANGQSGLLTFDPHPTRILYPERATQLMMPLTERIAKVFSLAHDCVWVQSFTQEFARMQADEFLPYVRQKIPQLRSLHVGENFRFGRDRAGGVDTLVKTAERLGIAVHVLDRTRQSGDAISSSRIRTLLVQGKVRPANALLGYAYGMRGVVRPGRQLGRELGFPTLNLAWEAELQPAYGVYAVRVAIDAAMAADKTVAGLPGIANLGLRPTVENNASEPLLEVHLFSDGKMPVSGDALRVEFIDFVRPERKFADTAGLKRQIARDVEQVRAVFAPTQAMNQGSHE